MIYQGAIINFGSAFLSFIRATILWFEFLIPHTRVGTKISFAL